MAEVDGEAPLGGTGVVVEVNDNFVGRQSAGIDWRKRKTVLVGMTERGGDGETPNSIEDSFDYLKRSSKGTHNGVSPKYHEACVKEFEYRFNCRTTPEGMLGELLSRFPELDP